MPTRTLVYGLGESGISAARALLARNEDVTVADRSDDEKLRKAAAELGVKGVFGATEPALDGVERIVVSPGISPKDGLLREAERRAERREIAVISEVGLGLEMLDPGARVAAITGTNGKTTAVDMLRAILEAGGVSHTVAGNSWRALTGCLEEVEAAGTLALELSSFQLHYLPGERYGFEVGGLLNVRPDHLNWHSSYDEYVRDKLRIFDGQDEKDLALVSANDPAGREAAAALKARAITVGARDTAVVDEVLVVEGREVVSVEELGFAGSHNHENALFAAVAALRLGVSVEDARRALVSYRLKPHRMEVVVERGGVLWIDDSKATNPAATAAALASFGPPRKRPVVLLLGGSEKDTDFGEILPFVGGCRAVVCCGEAGPRLHEWLVGEGFGGSSSLVVDLEAAVSVASSVARSGDVVLLSPGCASFDEFSGYAARGEVFASLARNISVSVGEE